MPSLPVLRRPSVISGLYVLLAGTWVIGTSLLAGGSSGPTLVEVAKGGGFVVVSGVILFVSLRRQAKASWEDAARYRELADNVIDVIYRVGLVPTMRFEYVSPSATALTGYEPEAFYRDPSLWQKIVHPDDRSKVDDVGRQLDDGAPVRLRLIRRDGTVGWIEQRSRPIVDRAGRCFALQGVARDVTAAVEAEEQLRYQAGIIDQIEDAVAITDADDRVSHWSRGAERLSGVAAADAVGRALTDVCAFEVLRPGGLAGVREETPPGGRVRGEATCVRADGTTGHLEFTTAGTHDALGNVARVSVVRDVTVPRRESAMLRSMFDASPLGICVTGPDRRIRYWNPALEGILGWSADEVAGAPVADYLQCDRDFGPDGGTLEVPLAASDGELVPVRIAAAPLHDGAFPMGYIKFVEDLRDHKRLEDQLRQAQKLEAVGSLAGGIAHDFNNLLTVIRGYGQIVASGLDGDAAADCAQLLHAADRAAEMTRHLLAFSRRDTGEQESVDVDRVLGAALPMVQRLVPSGVTLTAKLTAAAEVVTSPVEIEQILLNLVVNAVDAIGETGGIAVETRREWLTRDFVDSHLGAVEGAHLLLSVSDTGHGMNEATRARIFEPFFTTKGPGRGTGLGLATVYGIVQRARGTIWVYSEVGRGTSFKIYLPVAGQASTVRTEPQPELARGTERVLLVEDQPMVRDLAARALRRFGYDVVAATDAPGALTLAREQAFDVLVTDIVMPELSGLEVADRLDLPVVFVSGYPGSSLPSLRLDVPGRQFVEKPFEPVTLAIAVRTVIDERRTYPTTAESRATSAGPGPAGPGSRRSGRSRSSPHLPSPVSSKS